MRISSPIGVKVCEFSSNSSVEFLIDVDPEIRVDSDGQDMRGPENRKRKLKSKDGNCRFIN